MGDWVGQRNSMKKAGLIVCNNDKPAFFNLFILSGVVEVQVLGADPFDRLKD
ncbi:hypothetical protein [Fictibacillus phosphorivorans]|uniref:hypothetical protein n=1 Tax=Fictibacillus phosphorivorans TaxID=1221500 RepID=UPI0020401428|nr:hypothetical protein [Fictibacillus phosphorivorans]MCM3718201.1 hypothetical protein [Fictibacillus phosphorivorans]MCM3775932.1 hypothetical protein [Fictibacillus phosphorivorans]